MVQRSGFRSIFSFRFCPIVWIACGGGGERCERRHTSRFGVVYWFVVVRSFVRLLVLPLVGWLMVGWFVFSLFRWFVGWLVGGLVA